MQSKIVIDQNIELRKVDEKFANEKYHAALASRDHLLPWLNWIHFYESCETTADGIKKMQDFQKSQMDKFDKGTNYTYDIFYDNNFAGSIELMNISNENHYLEIGYWLAKDFTKKGIMSKAVNALTEIAFKKLEMHCVTILAADKNIASCSVAKRCGFTLEATLKDRIFLEGKYYNRCVFSKINPNTAP